MPLDIYSINEDLKDLKNRADKGDISACIELADKLLERAGPKLNEKNFPISYLYEDLSKYKKEYEELDINHLQDDSKIKKRLHYLDAMIIHFNKLIQNLEHDNPYFREAYKYCFTAANLGDTEGMYRLGYRLLLGEGVEKNEREAIKWWKDAAKKGDEKSLKILLDKEIIYLLYLTKEDIKELFGDRTKASIQLIKELIKKGEIINAFREFHKEEDKNLYFKKIKDEILRIEYIINSRVKERYGGKISYEDKKEEYNALDHFIVLLGNIEMEINKI